MPDGIKVVHKHAQQESLNEKILEILLLKVLSRLSNIKN